MCVCVCVCVCQVREKLRMAQEKNLFLEEELKLANHEVREGERSGEMERGRERDSGREI